MSRDACDSDDDNDNCPGGQEIANQGVKEPDNPLDRRDFPDFDLDGHIDFDDFGMFAGEYATFASSGAMNQQADLDSDGRVGFR